MGKLKLVLGARTGSGPPEPPVGLNVTFGDLTRSGHGGVPTGLTAGTAITGPGAADWVIDSFGHLTPSGTAHAQKTFSQSSYNLEIGGNPCNITMVPNVFHIRQNPGDVGNSVTGTQLRYLLQLTTAGKIDPTTDHIRIRESQSSLNMVLDIRPPAPTSGNWTDPVHGGAMLMVTADDPENPPTMTGFTFRNTNGNFYCPIVFDGIIHEASPIAPFSLFAYTNAYDCVWGVSFQNGWLQRDPSMSVEAATNINGVTIVSGETTPAWCKNMRVRSIGKSVLLSSLQTAGRAVNTTIEGNTFEDPHDDCMVSGISGSISPNPILPGVHNKITRGNLGFGGIILLGAHADFNQDQGSRADTAYTERPLGTTAFNAYLARGNTGTQGLQVDFNDDTVSPHFITNARFHGEILCSSAQHGIWLTRFKDPVVQCCTVLTNLSAEEQNCQIIVPEFKGGVGGTVTHNLLTSPVNFTNQTGPYTIENNVVLTQTLEGIQAALPNWKDDASLETWEDVFIAYTPSEFGAARLVDGTYAGALFPAAPGQPWGSRNDMTVYDPGNPTWLAAHPPASGTSWPALP